MEGRSEEEKPTSSKIPVEVTFLVLFVDYIRNNPYSWIRWLIAAPPAAYYVVEIVRRMVRYFGSKLRQNKDRGSESPERS
ncbi:hypothetical protein AB0M95_13575 [Sphaerisporangium sp. NPDC051017]|uniref:hypothetical protein n=1 Tax=Sphaerisporangium sp. NPDC051017 TaxID=3154636 RepID=UPI003443EDCB